MILTHGFEVNKGVVENLLQKYDIDAAELEIIPGAKKNSLGKNLNELTRRCDGAYLFRMDDDDYYGPNYIRDLGNILKVTGADLAGKNATYIYFEEANVTVLTFPGKEHRFTDFVRGATFCGPKETFLRWHFPEESTGEDSSLISKIKKDRGIVYAADRFNFAVMRHTEKSDHTWTVDDDNLFATGEMKFVGFDPRQVNV